MKGRTKLDGVLVAEVTGDTPRKSFLFEDFDRYPEYEGGVSGLYTSAFGASYPECELNKIHVIEHTTELLVDALMPTLVGTTSLKKTNDRPKGNSDV